MAKSYPATAAVPGFPIVIGGYDAALATTAIDYYIVAPFDGRITDVDILDTSAVARSNTDYMTITVTKQRSMRCWRRYGTGWHHSAQQFCRSRQGTGLNQT